MRIITTLCLTFSLVSGSDVLCPDRITTCRNGGTCELVNVPDQGGEYICDCINAFNEDGIYEGAECEHKHTDTCGITSIEEAALSRAFCTNNGKCVVVDGAYECECDDSWSGEHCQHTKSGSNSAPAPNFDQDGKIIEAEHGDVPAGTIVIVTVACVSVVAIIAYVVHRKMNADIVEESAVGVENNELELKEVGSNEGTSSDEMI